MNEFKHTPGNWEVDKQKSSIVRMNDYLRIEQIATAENLPECMSLDDLEAEGNSNAKLIAAAPDLLDAAQYAIECLERLNTELGQIGDNGDQAYNALKQAIEKATK